MVSKSRALKAALLRLVGIALLAALPVRPAAAAGSNGVLVYVDQRTGQMFMRPGAGRTRMVLPTVGMETARLPETKVKDMIKEEVSRSNADLQQQLDQARIANAAMASEIQQMQPPVHQFGERWMSKIKIGTLLYGDYSFYTHTGYGPQFLDAALNPPGPGNNSYNSFDITRTYINFFFTPTPDVTFRLTPDLYRTQGNGTAFSGSRTSAVASNLNGNLGFRLKYAYLDFNSLFKRSPYLSEDKVTFGQEPNPLVAWEEDLYGFRYVNLTPWNYASLSSAQIGLSVHGPIKYNELQYIDYDVGVYDNANYRSFEQTSTKQVMGRASIYPFGARSRFDGLGLTGFYNYGYSNTAPDNSAPFVANSAAKDGYISRLAALAHYQALHWGLAFEYDRGHNAFNSGNLFSANGPPAEFGVGANTPTTQGVIYDALTRAFQNNGSSVQQGFDAFGHYDIPNTPLTAFGMFQWLMPNTKVSTNLNDFQRYTVGVQYQYNKYLRLALDSQNLMFYEGGPYPGPSEIASFVPKPATGLGAVTGITPFLLNAYEHAPRDTHSFFLNVEFAY